MRLFVVLTLFFISFLSADFQTSSQEIILKQHKKLGLTKEEIQYINSTKTILVSNEFDYEPYDFAKNQKAMGYSIDLLDLLLKNTGLKAQYITKSWTELLKDLDDKKIDLMHTVYKTPQREKKYLYSFGYSKVIQSYVIRKNSQNIEDIKQLFGKKVGVSKGWAEEKFFDQYPQVQKVYFNNLKEKLDALSLGEIDAIINSDNVAYYYIKKNGYSNLKVSEPVKNIAGKQLNTHHFITLKEEPYLISILDKAYNNLSIQELQKLERKWFGKSEKVGELFFTQEEQEWLEKKIPVTYVYDIDWEPFEWKSKIDTHIGIIADLLHLISQKSGMIFEAIHTSSWDKAVLLAQNNKVDMFSAVPFDTKRLQYMNFTENDIFQYNAVLLKNKRDTRSYKDISKSLENRTIAIVKKSSLGNSIKQKFPQAKYIEVEKTQDGFQKLEDQKVDLFAINSVTAHLMVYHKRYRDLEVAVKFTDKYKLKVAVSKSMPKEVLSIIDKTLSSISDKEMNNIYNRWMHPVVIDNKIDWISIFYIFSVLFIVISLILYRQKILSDKNKQIQELYTLTEIEKNKLDTLIQNIPDLLWIKDEKGVFLSCNKRFESLYGAKEKDIVGKTDYDFVDKDLADFFKEHDMAAMQSDKALSNFEEVEFKSDGHKETLQTIKVKIKHKNGEVLGVLGIGRDMSEVAKLTNQLKALNESLELKVEEKTEQLKKANQILDENRRKLEMALNENLFGYWEFDLQNNTVKFSDGGYQILGYDGASDYDTDTVTWVQRVHPDDVDKSEKEFNKLLNGEIQKYHIVHRVHNKQKRYIWLDVRAVVLQRDESGKASIIIGIFRDITTERSLQKQLNTLNDKLEQQNLTLEERVKVEVEKGIKGELLLAEQQKHAQMGLMIGNIAHQFRQPLSIISTIASGIIANIEYNIPQDDEKILKEMNHVLERAQYLSDTITIFRNFLKEDKVFKKVILQDRIDMALRIVSMSLKDNGIQLINNIDYEKKIFIKLVIGELSEVLINLINNAKDILLEKEVSKPWVKVDIEQEQDKVIISIEDNGGGIPEDILPHIYDRYFTTKDEDKGTGLGLHMSKQIVEKSLKGKLSVINSEHGAKFLIELKYDK